jgi:hypothetical protein
MALALGLLLGLVVFVQTLGLMHQGVHSPHGPQGLAAAQAPTAHDAGLAPTHAHSPTHGHGHGHGQSHTSADGGVAVSWLERLFIGHDEGSGACRIFDQHGHSAPVLAPAPLFLPSVLRAVLPPAAIACERVAAAALFEARAPPFLR